MKYLKPSILVFMLINMAQAQNIDSKSMSKAMLSNLDIQNETALASDNQKPLKKKMLKEL